MAEATRHYNSIPDTPSLHALTNKPVTTCRSKWVNCVIIVSCIWQTVNVINHTLNTNTNKSQQDATFKPDSAVQKHKSNYDAVSELSMSINYVWDKLKLIEKEKPLI
jgi:hypothetical protein